MWTCHCRSSLACPMAFIALSVHRMFCWALEGGGGGSDGVSVPLAPSGKACAVGHKEPPDMQFAATPQGNPTGRYTVILSANCCSNCTRVLSSTFLYMSAIICSTLALSCAAACAR